MNNRMRPLIWCLAAAIVLGGVLSVGDSASNLASAADPHGKSALSLGGDLRMAHRVAGSDYASQIEPDSDVPSAAVRQGSQMYPLPALERTEYSVSAMGQPLLRDLPRTLVDWQPG